MPRTKGQDPVLKGWAWERKALKETEEEEGQKDAQRAPWTEARGGAGARGRHQTMGVATPSAVTLSCETRASQEKCCWRRHSSVVGGIWKRKRGWGK